LGVALDAIRIALVSDDRLFCDGVAGILISGTGFEVTTYDAQHAASVGDVDVVLIDSRLDDALALCAAVRPAASLLIAAPAGDEWCRDALCAGASGVLPKTARGQELLSAVRVVHEGSIWAPRRVMASCIRHMAESAPRRPEVRLEQQLSAREREIFLQAATGLANKELASRFAIGEATVKAHLTRIFQKLGVRGRAELAAVYHGVVPVRAPRPPASAPLLALATPVVVRRKSNLATAERPKK
jgi:DNA-binding NarL/FixJ family response regulator